MVTSKRNYRVVLGPDQILSDSNSRIKRQRTDPQVTPDESSDDSASVVSADIDYEYIPVDLADEKILDIMITDQSFSRPIDRPERMDVLFGRGKRFQKHPGNVRLRIIIDIYRPIYEPLAKLEKTKLSKQLVGVIKYCGTSPGRFIKYDAKSEAWYQVPDDEARLKVIHLLREIM